MDAADGHSSSSAELQRQPLHSIGKHMPLEEQRTLAEAAALYPEAFTRIAEDFPHAEIAALWGEQPEALSRALRLETELQSSPSARSRLYQAYDLLGDIALDQDMPIADVHEVAMLPESLLWLMMRAPEEIGTPRFDTRETLDQLLQAQDESEYYAAAMRFGENHYHANEAGEWALAAIRQQREAAYQRKSPVILAQLATHIDPGTEPDFLRRLPEIVGPHDHHAMVKQLFGQLEQATEGLPSEERKAAWRGAAHLLTYPDGGLYYQYGQCIDGFLRLAKSVGRTGLPLSEELNAYNRINVIEGALKLLDRHAALPVESCLTLMGDAPMQFKEIGFLDGQSKGAALEALHGRLRLKAEGHKITPPDLEELFRLPPELLHALVKGESENRINFLHEEQIKRALDHIVGQRPLGFNP